MKKMTSRTKRILTRLIKRESGAAPLMMVLVMLVVAGLVIAPIMAFVVSGMKQGQSHEGIMQQFYSADTGLEDAMWKIKNYEDEDWPAWMRGAWTESTYTHTPPYLEYTLPGSDNINNKVVTVRIQPIWLLEGVETPKSGQGRTPNDNVTMTGDVTAVGKYEVAILKDAGFTDPLIIDKIGIWLPPGFEYVAGSSNLESSSNPLPPTGSRCTPTTTTFRNGTLITWTYSTPIDYTKLPMDKSGKATSVSSGRLEDSASNQFSKSDVGRSVYNATDDKWGLITAYNSSSNLSVSPSSLFDTKDDRYEIGEPSRRVVAFSFTAPAGKMVPDGAFSWVSSPGSTTPSVPAYLWWTGDKLYKIVSTGADPTTGKTTTVTAYTTKEQLKDFGGSMNADYVAIGNTLLMDYNVDNPYGEGDENGSERGDGLYRDRLYAESPATLASLPGGTRLQQVRLYWSGWKNDPWDTRWMTDAQRSALVGTYFVGRVSFKVEVSGQSYETTVTADSWQVLPGSTSQARGWNYSCYADVTDEVEAAKQYFLDRGVAFIGNAKYTVGHADSSEFTTQPLQGIWGSSASDVFVVGQGGSILHYDGTAWNLMTSGTTNHLYGIWGSSGTDVFAVGGGGTILHYDGSAWSSMTSGTTNVLYGVWGASGTDVFAVGAGGKVLHYNGSTWSSMASGTTNDLRGVWGNSGTNVFAVGANATIIRYNGSAWSSMSVSGQTSQTLYSVWGSDSTHVWAVGTRPSSGNTYFRFYNGSGSSWTNQDCGVRRHFYGVWGTSDSNVLAVGASGDIRRYNGSWSAMDSGTAGQLNGIWGNASNSVFSVGTGIIIRNDGVDDNGDGSLWDPMIGDTTAYEWVDGHTGEDPLYRTAYPLANTTSYGSTRIDQAAYGAWSMIAIYSSPETKGHQLYLYDTFRFYHHYEENFSIKNFLAPQDVLTDPNAARMTCFIAEGDDVLGGDTIKVNGTLLSGGVPYACNPVNNVWNSKSSVAGLENIGIDIDTFLLSYLVQPGATEATVTVHTDDDGWCMVYMIVSFRSTISSGGISSIKVE